MEDSDLKLYYSIKEVSEMYKIAFSNLRFYEKQFPQFKPKRNSKGIRQYSKKDLEILKGILELVKDEGHTLNGAREKLKETVKQNKNEVLINKLQKIKVELIKIKGSL